jgi:hypothetical protein
MRIPICRVLRKPPGDEFAGLKSTPDESGSGTPFTGCCSVDGALYVLDGMLICAKGAGTKGAGKPRVGPLSSSPRTGLTKSSYIRGSSPRKPPRGRGSELFSRLSLHGVALYSTVIHSCQ